MIPCHYNDTAELAVKPLHVTLTAVARVKEHMIVEVDPAENRVTRLDLEMNYGHVVANKIALRLGQELKVNRKTMLVYRFHAGKGEMLWKKTATYHPDLVHMVIRYMISYNPTDYGYMASVGMELETKRPLNA